MDENNVKEFAQDLCACYVERAGGWVEDDVIDITLTSQKMVERGYVKQRKGVWIVTHDHHYAKCSCCETSYEVLPQYAPTIFAMNNKYCRGCGAEMTYDRTKNN